MSTTASLSSCLSPSLVLYPYCPSILESPWFGENAMPVPDSVDFGRCFICHPRSWITQSITPLHLVQDTLPLVHLRVSFSSFSFHWNIKRNNTAVTEQPNSPRDFHSSLALHLENRPLCATRFVPALNDRCINVICKSQNPHTACIRMILCRNTVEPALGPPITRIRARKNGGPAMGRTKLIERESIRRVR